MEIEEVKAGFMEQVVLNGLILNKIFSGIPFRQFLETRLVCRIWDDAVRHSLPNRARLDLSLCTMPKKAEDKKKSEIEQKLDLAQYLKLSELVLGIEDELHPVITEAFKEIGPYLEKLTIKINLEEEKHFEAFSSILKSSPDLKELVWWGIVNESHCHKMNFEFPSVKSLELGFYAGESPNMGRRAILWIASVFPNITFLSFLPHHREGLMPDLLKAWGEGSLAFSHLTEITIHQNIKEGRLSPLENLPQGLKFLNLTINGKRETGGVEDFTPEDAAVLSSVLKKQGKSLEKLVINFLNLWKPKPLVEVEFPEMIKLKSFSVTSDFSGDIFIDFKPSPSACYPNLSILSLSYFGAEAFARFFANGDNWNCRRLKSLDFKLKEKLSSWIMNPKNLETVGNLEKSCAEVFPNTEVVDLILLQNWIQQKGMKLPK